MNLNYAADANARIWLHHIVWYLYTSAPEKKETGAALGSRVPRPGALDPTIKLRDLLQQNIDPRLETRWDIHNPALFVVSLTAAAIWRLDFARDWCNSIAEFLERAPNRTSHGSTIGAQVLRPRNLDRSIKLKQVLTWDHRFRRQEIPGTTDFIVTLSAASNHEVPLEEQPADVLITKWLNDIYAYLVNKPEHSEQGALLGAKVPRPPQLPATVKLKEVIVRDPRLATLSDASTPPNILVYLASDPPPHLTPPIAPSTPSRPPSAPPITHTQSNGVDLRQVWLDRIVQYLQRNPVERLLGSQIGLHIPKPHALPSSVKLKDLVLTDPRLKYWFDESKTPPTLFVSLNNTDPAQLWVDRMVAYLQGTTSGVELISTVLAKLPRPEAIGRDVNIVEILNNDPQKRLRLVKNTTTTPPTYSLRLMEQKVATPQYTSVTTSLTVRDDNSVAAIQWRNAVATFLETEFRQAASLPDVLAAVPLPEILRSHSPMSLLSDAPQRFELVQHPRTHEGHVGLKDTAPEPLPAPKPVDEVVDEGDPEDTSEPFPPAEATWETPEALRSVTVTTASSVSYNVTAPLELKNKDYVRRILDIVGDGIAICIQKIMAKPKPVLDIYFQLKDMIQYAQNFSIEFRCSSAQWSFLTSQIQLIYRTRNGLMHMNLGIDNSASVNFIEKLFQASFRLLSAFNLYATRVGGINAPAVAIATMINLRKQYRWHTSWNVARKNVDASPRLNTEYDRPAPEIDLISFGDDFEDSNFMPSPVGIDEQDLLGIDATEALSLFFEPTDVKVVELQDDQIQHHTQLYLSAILKKEGKIYEDDFLTITYSIELLDGSLCKLVLSYSNITLNILKNFQVSVHDFSRIGNIQLGPCENSLEVKTEQFIIIELTHPGFPGPDLRVEYMDHMGVIHRGEVRLPITACSFNSPVEMTGDEYVSEWEAIGEDSEMSHSFHCECPSDEMTFVASQLFSFIKVS